jgi:1,4-alpha-glucan branching enzyme
MSVGVGISGKEGHEMAKAKKANPTAKAAPAAAAKKPAAAKPAAAKTAGIEKKYLKARPACKVTFVLPKEAASDAESVCILGEFNSWAQDAHPLKRLKGGDFTITLELETGRSYRFRYIIDGWKYENDWFADRYEPNPYGGEDSVVDV